MTSEPADGRTERAAIRRLISILAVCGFASALTTRYVDPMVTVISRDLGADPLSVALLSSAYALPYALIQPVLGPVGDTVGKEFLIKLLMVGLTVTLLAGSFAPNLPTLFVLRVLAGLAAGGIIPMSLALVGDRVAMGERQVAIGRMLTAIITGQLVGGIAAGVLSEGIGWRGVFVVAALLSGLACAAALFGFRDVERATGELSFRSAIRRYGHIVRIGRVQALMAFVFVEGTLVFGSQPYIAAMFERAGTGGAAEAGLALAGFAVGGILYTLVVRWLLRMLGLLRLLRVGGLLSGLGMLALAPALPTAFAVGAMLVLGLGFYMLHNSYQTQMTEAVPDARASAMSMHAFGFFIGQAIGPALFGLLLADLGRVATLSICAAGILGLGLASALILGRPAPTLSRENS